MRILHTMLRVGNLEKSLAFYTEVLGMKLLRRHDYPEGKFTLAFVGYSDEASGAVIELTYNWGVEKYELGNGYGHIAIEVDDAYAACELVKQRATKWCAKRVCAGGGYCSASRRKWWCRWSYRNERRCITDDGRYVPATLRAISCLLCRSNAISDGCSIRGADKVPSF